VKKENEMKKDQKKKKMKKENEMKKDQKKKKKAGVFGKFYIWYCLFFSRWKF
jgi:hypothetical protein